MKTVPFLALFAFLTLTSSYFSTVISAPVHKTFTTAGTFSHFRVHRQGNAVALSWAVSSPDVTQFVVERSYDGEFFEPVTEMNCTGNSVHQFKDANIYPGIIYYKIKAVKADATTEDSAVESVRIVQRG